MSEKENSQSGEPSTSRRRRRRRRKQPNDRPRAEAAEVAQAPSDSGSAEDRQRKRRRRRRPARKAEASELRDAPASSAPKGSAPQGRAQEVMASGVVEILKNGSGMLRDPQKNMADQKDDVFIPKATLKKFFIKAGSVVEGKASGGQMRFVESIDGMEMSEHRRRKTFKKLTVIDPDFQYELGTHEQDGQVSMRILDLLSPLGRGQRALLVAPPRSGKTMIMQQMARAVQALYTDVHLIVLLVDERPEEATYWKREAHGAEVYVSSMDESPKNHVRLAELVQQRAERLVEAGQDVVLLMDSITRLARAYNNTIGGNGKTMSGGLDARTMAKPKHFFGNARNTETAGSLTIVGTTLVETGSRMDQVIFEEFKGTGNMELVLDRRLADRRIFPAIAVDRTGTRKEEKMRTRQAQKKVDILRRVLSRMRPMEAMELLASRLPQFPTNREFLAAFSMDDVE